MAFFTDRKRIRLADYSYSSKGAYFVTICAANRKPVFSRINANEHVIAPEVMLTDVGRIIQENIEYICAAYPYVSVDKYTIMPNHIHLLLQIHMDAQPVNESRDKMLISKIVQSFKASVSRQIPDSYKPLWQRSFYDRIVRDENDYLRIWKYIDDNPAAWLEDDYYVSG